MVAGTTVGGGQRLELDHDVYLRAVRLAYLLTGSRELAEDVAQDVYVRCLARTDVIQAWPYVRTAIAHAVIDWRRRRDRERRALPLLYTDVAVTDETREMLDVVGRLEPRSREFVVLRYWAGMTDAEIARATGAPLGTVKASMFRALRRLRRELEDLR